MKKASKLITGRGPSKEARNQVSKSYGGQQVKQQETKQLKCNNAGNCDVKKAWKKDQERKQVQKQTSKLQAMLLPQKQERNQANIKNSN